MFFWCCGFFLGVFFYYYYCWGKYIYYEIYIIYYNSNIFFELKNISKKKGDKMKTQEILNEFLPTLLIDHEELKEYLGNLKYFHKYSLRNLLIAQEDYYLKYGKYPEGYWSTYKQFQDINRQVQKGQKGSIMLRPQKKKFEYEDQNGNKKEVINTYYVPFRVFDVSQTEGEELQKINTLYDGISILSEDDILMYLEQYYNVNKVKYIIKKGSTDGKNINISYSEGTSINSRINTMIHELAHCKLDHFNRKISRNIMEVEAETTAYIITTLLNIKNDKSRLYVAGWGGNETLKILKKSSGKILNVADNIVRDLNKLYGVSL